MYRFKGYLTPPDYFKYKNLLCVKWNSIRLFNSNKISALTKIKKSSTGVSRSVGILVRKKRETIFNFFSYDNSSTLLFKTKPSMSIGSFDKLNKGKNLTLYTTSGGLKYYDSTVKYSLFDYYFIDVIKFLPKNINVIASTWLIFLKLGLKIKSIKIFNRESSEYSKSVGSFSILSAYDFWTGNYIIKLPSGYIKLFFLASTASIFDEEADKSRSSKITFQNAGFSSKIGKKPKVRGVAMNPVDHPHGGRTKSVKFQRTPWGFPAKSLRK